MKGLTALLRAVDAYGLADRRCEDLPHYQGCALEEPMKSAMAARQEGQIALAKAARAFYRANQPRKTA